LKRENNKLKALNDMLKNKDFDIKLEDEDEFESFMQKLHEKRNQSISLQDVETESYKEMSKNSPPK